MTSRLLQYNQSIYWQKGEETILKYGTCAINIDPPYSTIPTRRGATEKSPENSLTYLLICALMVNIECNLCACREWGTRLINAFMTTKCNMADHWLHWGLKHSCRTCTVWGTVELYCSGHPQGYLLLCGQLGFISMSHSRVFFY